MNRRSLNWELRQHTLFCVKPLIKRRLQKLGVVSFRYVSKYYYVYPGFPLFSYLLFIKTIVRQNNDNLVAPLLPILNDYFQSFRREVFVASMTNSYVTAISDDHRFVFSHNTTSWQVLVKLYFDLLVLIVEFFHVKVLQPTNNSYYPTNLSLIIQLDFQLPLFQVMVTQHFPSQ